MKQLLQYPETLKHLMQRNSINAHQLAKAIHVSHVAIGNYLDGRPISSSQILVELANHFGVSTDYILGREARSDKNLEKLLASELGESADRLRNETLLYGNEPWARDVVGRLRRVPDSQRRQLLEAIKAMIAAVDVKR